MISAFYPVQSTMHAVKYAGELLRNMRRCHCLVKLIYGCPPPCLALAVRLAQSLASSNPRPTASPAPPRQLAPGRPGRQAAETRAPSCCRVSNTSSTVDTRRACLDWPELHQQCCSGSTLAPMRRAPGQQRGVCTSRPPASGCIREQQQWQGAAAQWQRLTNSGSKLSRGTRYAAGTAGRYL